MPGTGSMDSKVKIVKLTNPLPKAIEQFVLSLLNLNETYRTILKHPFSASDHIPKIFQN
ncbi:hypothetical protein FHR29_001867 [Sphingobacterium sp. JUb56]|nr:hypothetical protein [Sphingobacterium sp. JUb56]